MSLANRITSLLTSLTPGQVGALAPADRQLLADQCARVLRLLQADKAPPPAKSGVLGDLGNGHRGE